MRSRSRIWRAISWPGTGRGIDVRYSEAEALSMNIVDTVPTEYQKRRVDSWLPEAWGVASEFGDQAKA